MKRVFFRLLILVFAMICATAGALQASDPLPSWNEGATKQAIIKFVEDVSIDGGPLFVPLEQRIAVFDNDGTLWSEQPMFVQMVFTLDRVKALAPNHPEWKEKQPFKAVLEGDLQRALAGGDNAITELLLAAQADNTISEFSQIVKNWLATAKHPKTGRLYTQMVYQPMLELLDYMRTNGFKTYIASGGGMEFMRAWSEKTYGIPPEQVIGSSSKTKFEIRNGTPVLVRLAELSFLNDKSAKPVGINQHIGRRPIAAFGNADHDLQMLQWTTAGSGARFGLLVHHTDSERESAYDRKSSSGGRLDKALDEAQAKGWTVVDMKRDWKKIFPFDNS